MYIHTCTYIYISIYTYVYLLCMHSIASECASDCVCVPFELPADEADNLFRNAIVCMILRERVCVWSCVTYTCMHNRSAPARPAPCKEYNIMKEKLQARESNIWTSQKHKQLTIAMYLRYLNSYPCSGSCRLESCVTCICMHVHICSLKHIQNIFKLFLRFDISYTLSYKGLIMEMSWREMNQLVTVCK